MRHPARRFFTTALLTAGLSLAAVAYAGPGLLPLTKPSGQAIYIAPRAIMYAEPSQVLSMPMQTTASAPVRPWPPWTPPATCLTLSTVSSVTPDVWPVEGASVLPSRGASVPTHDVVCVVEDLTQIQQLLTE